MSAKRTSEQIDCPVCGKASRPLAPPIVRPFYGNSPESGKPCTSVARQRRKCGCGKVFMHAVYVSRETKQG